jgi:hypothetical protein
MKLTPRRTLVALVAGIALFAGSGAALANGGFGIFGAFGFSGSSNQTALLNDVANRLDVSPTKLRSAIKDAVKAQVDQQVKDGLLTKTQGDAVKEQIDNGAVGVSAGLRGGFGIRDLDVIAAAADYLDQTPAQLRDALSAGKSLADVAKDKDKPVDGLQNAIVDKATSQLAAAVSAGDLTDAQRDSFLTQLKNSVDELVAQTYRGFGFRGGHGFFGKGPAFGGGRAFRS